MTTPFHHLQSLLKLVELFSRCSFLRFSISGASADYCYMEYGIRYNSIGLYDYRTIVFGSKNSIWSGKQDVLSCHVFAKRESILRLQRTVSSLYRTIEGLVSVSQFPQVSEYLTLHFSDSTFLQVDNSTFPLFYYSKSRKFHL